MTKEISYYMTPSRNKEMTVERMKHFQHVFILRHPKVTLESFFRTTQSKSSGGVSAKGGYFNADEAGFKELVEIYKWVKEHIEDDPLVINGDDFVKDPETTERVFEHICSRVGMRFDKSMLTWDKRDQTTIQPKTNNAFHDDIN